MKVNPDDAIPAPSLQLRGAGMEPNRHEEPEEDNRFTVAEGDRFTVTWEDDVIEAYSPQDLVNSGLRVPYGLFGKGRIVRTEVSLLVGLRGTGKTYLSLKMGCAIALGESFGCWPTIPGNTLYLSMEMGLGSMAERFRLMTLESERVRMQNHFWMFGPNPNFVMDKDMGAICVKNLAQKYSADLIIIDSLRDIIGKASEISNDDMGTVLKRLRWVARHANCAVLVLHHMGKAARTAGANPGSRGASVIEDIAADQLELWNDAGLEPHEKSLLWTKSRHAEPMAPMVFSLRTRPKGIPTLDINVRMRDFINPETSGL